MQDSLSFLGSDQLEAMSRRTEGMKWSDETLKKGFILYFGLGNRAYDMISKVLKIPMPSIRSLQRCIKSHEPHSEFFNYVFDTIKEVSQPLRSYSMSVVASLYVTFSRYVDRLARSGDQPIPTQWSLRGA